MYGVRGVCGVRDHELRVNVTFNYVTRLAKLYMRWKTSLHARTFSRIAPANMASENLSSKFAKKTAGEREATERANRSSPLPSER